MGKVDFSNFRSWNQYAKYYHEIGSGVPVWCELPARFITGGLIQNKLELGEYLAGGTPVEYDVKTKKAKLLKLWKVEKVATSGSDTTITLKKSWDLPLIKGGDVVMVVPATLKGTGKAVKIDKIDDSKETEVTITVATADIDAVAVGKFLGESAATATGSGASLYAIPNSLTLEETVGGDQNSVGIARGHKYIYQNTIPPMPEVVSGAIPDLYFDYFNEVQSSGYAGQ